MKRSLTASGLAPSRGRSGAMTSTSTRDPREKNIDPLAERIVERDPKVVAIHRKLALVERTRRQLVAALDVERAEALYRLSQRRAEGAATSGEVMAESARRSLSEAVEAFGVDYVAQGLGLSPALLERLLAGIPTPPSWTELPEERAEAAE